MTEQEIEQALIEKLVDLKYAYCPDIRDRATLEANFRQHFQALNRVHLTDTEFARLLENIVTPDVFAAAKHLRERNSFERDDGTPLYYTLVNIKDWCKNSFEVINQLRINTDYSHHRYDVILLINGIPAVQIELKTLQISPRRAMQQIVDYKHDPGNGYSKTLLCFLQLFIVSNRGDTWYFANNNSRHFSFNADERFLPLYQFADVDNSKINHLDSFAEAFLAKCTLGEMISRYMVLVASEQKLLMMRPYQIYAVKAIVDCIHQHCGNGYFWHTTGCGNDFLISKRQIVHCACGVVPKALDGSIVSNEYSVLRARDGFDVLFFDYFAQQSTVSQSFLCCSIGIVIEEMLFKLNDWLKEEFLFPSFQEQRKIAECLTSLDDLITVQTQKLIALKTHKKGLMQQLFPVLDEVAA